MVIINKISLTKLIFSYTIIKKIAKGDFCMKKLLCILISVLLITSALITTSAADVSTSVSATSDEAEQTNDNIYKINNEIFYYNLLDDGTAELVGYIGSKNELIIPERLNGYELTKIDFYAFTNPLDWSYAEAETIYLPSTIREIDCGFAYTHSFLKNIFVDKSNQNFADIDGVLFNKDKTELLRFPGARAGHYSVPKSVITIGNAAFENCCRLESVYIPPNVKMLSSHAFSNCEKLSSVILSEGLEDMGYAQVFYCCDSLESITLPSTLKNLAFTQTFSYCKNLKEVILKEGLTSIGWYSFLGCENLKRLHIPSTVDWIDSGAFNGCYQLNEITVDENNTAYYSENGILYNKERTEIVAVPKTIEGIFSVPDGIKSILYSAFADCNHLTEVIIPEGTETIGNCAFENCKNLIKVTLPRSLGEITYNESNTTFGFYHYNKIAEFKVYGYSGTIAEKYATDNGFEFISLGKGQGECNGIVYRLLNENEAAIIDYSGKSKILDIPEFIEEYKIVEIKKSFFQNCSETEIFNVPKNVNQIDTTYLKDNQNLSAINIETDNNTYYSIDGVLFSKVTNEMLLYPSKNETEILTVPEGIVKTCAINSNFLKTLNLPSTVTELGKIYCDSLENINVNEQNKNYCSVDGVLYDKEVTDLIHFPLASQITELLVPDTVTTVSAGIETTKHLKNITLGKNVKDFSGYVFTMHGELIENIFVDEDNPNFYSKNGVLYSKITNDVVAYPQNNRAKTFEIPESSNWIHGYGLLRDCKYIENVIVPTGITTLFTGGLCYCPNLKNIYVNEDNPAFCDIDGILYSKDRKTLLYYPRGRKEPTYNIYKNTEIIGITSFWGNIYLTNISIPDNVKKIDVGAFFNCENLKEITLPKNIVELSGIGWSCSSPGGHGEYIKYDDITIKGYSGTVAETYAKENGFTFISLGNVENVLGDANGDGVISILDATEIQKHLASISELNNNQISVADVNKDGIISIVDATEIQKFIAELPSVIKKS